MKKEIKKSLHTLGIKIEESSIEKASLLEFLKGLDKFDLEKSLQDEMQFNNSIIFNKTGLEIKENLNYLITKENIKKENLKSKLKEYEFAIGNFPTKEPNKYQLRNTQNINIELLPKYYDLCDNGFNSISQRDPIVYGNEEIKNETKENKIKYNYLVDKYIEALVEISYINTFINNLEDEQNYPLSANQLVVFGF